MLDSVYQSVKPDYFGMEKEENDIVVFRTRLRPSKTLAAALLRNCAGTRKVYNHVLQMQKERHEVFAAARKKFFEDNPKKKKKDFKPTEKEKPFSAYDLKKVLPLLKAVEETSWLAELDSQILQESVLNFGKTWTRFTKKISGYPRFRNRDQHNGFGRANGNKAKLIDGKRFKLSKVGWVKMYEEPNPKVSEETQYLIDNGKLELSIPSSYVVSLKANKWWISIRWQVPKTIILPREGDSVGIDLGVSKWGTTSKGDFIGRSDEIEKKLTNLLKRKDFYYRQLSRRPKQKNEEGKKTSGSNREKTKRKLAKVWNKIAEIKRNYSHHSSKELSTKFAKIALEELKIQKMVKSAKGTVEEPGKKVKQKTGLNRSINQQNWYQFRSMLEYKMTRNGGKVELVDPKNTSRMCSECGHVDEKNRKTQSEFKCLNCGHEENADLNAARNIHRIAFGE